MLKPQIYLIFNNIRSAYNVGSIFRTADGAGVSKIYICGITPTPDDIKVLKTSLGAEKNVPWEYHKQTWRLIKKLKNPRRSRLATLRGRQNSKIEVVALEQSAKSMNLFKYKTPKNKDVALIVGNEVHGLNKKILSYADKIVEIPIFGKKESLNVAVATGIALYEIIKH